MLRLARIVLLSLAALAALASAGCGKEETTAIADTEGIYVTVDDLTYQVQLSRILNPASPEDSAYLKGVSEEELDLSADDIWFAVFMRVENETDERLSPTDAFGIVDTQEDRFEPVEIDEERNVFVYDPKPIGPGELLPEKNSPASDNTIQGALVLFKLTVESLSNRPLEFEIESSQGGQTAIVDLDV
jgi:hypothetical protein